MKFEVINSARFRFFEDVAFVLVALEKIPDHFFKFVLPELSHIKEHLCIFLYPRMHFHSVYEDLQAFNLDLVKDEEKWISDLKDAYKNLDVNVIAVRETQNSQFASFIDALSFLGAGWGVFLHDDMFIPRAYLDGIAKAFGESLDKKMEVIGSNMVEAIGVVPAQNFQRYKNSYETIRLPKDLILGEAFVLDNDKCIYAAASYTDLFTKEDYRNIIKENKAFIEYLDFHKFNRYAEHVFHYFNEKRFYSKIALFHLDGGHLMKRSFLEKVRKYYDYLPTHTETFMMSVLNEKKLLYATVPYLTHAHMPNPHRIFSLKRAYMDFYVFKFVQENFVRFIQEI